MLWQDSKGKGHAYHEAKVRSVDVNENGESLVKLEYTDWQGAKDKVVSHNMAKEKAEGKHPWRRVKPKKAKVGDGDNDFEANVSVDVDMKLTETPRGEPGSASPSGRAGQRPHPRSMHPMPVHLNSTSTFDDDDPFDL